MPKLEKQRQNLRKNSLFFRRSLKHIGFNIGNSQTHIVPIIIGEPNKTILISNKLENKKIRIGGMVKDNSIVIDSENISFVITDFKNEINVNYSGLVPNLFKEGKGVVAEGFLKDKSLLIAEKILAKHDENYMPPEVKEALEKK